MATQSFTTVRKVALAVLAVVLLALSIPSIVYGLRAAWVDASTAGARRIVNGWRDGHGPRITPPLLAQTTQTLQNGTRTDPDNAQLHVDLGYIHMVQANGLEPHVEAGTPLAQYRLDLIDTALTHYRRVTEIRPRFPYGWGYLAIAKSKRAQPDDEMWGAFDKALALGRNEGGVQLAIAEVAFTHWPTISPQRKQNVLTMLERPNAEVRKDIQKIADRAAFTLPDR